MEIHYLLGMLSAVVFTLAYAPYVVSILKGRTKPHPFSWFLWSVIGVISLFFYIKVGAHETLPFAYCGAVLPFFIFFLSMRYWRGGFSKFDYLVLSVSLLSIVFYALFHSANVSLTISIIADMMAFLPTVRKTYIDPSSESFASWGMFLLSYILGVLAVSVWSYGVAVFPCYLLVFGVLMCSLILRGRLKKAQ